MFSTLKLRLLLGVYIFIVLSIPVGAYLASQAQIFKSKASENTNTTTVKSNPKSATSSAKELLSASQTKLLDNPNPTSIPAPASSSPTVATSFGPTLSLQAILEGRPANNQATKLFVGIVEGVLSANPKFLLSFTADLPAAGSYKNLSLAGLQSGNQYTALLKGATQIATASAFIMSPTVTNLNNGQPLNLLTGDLNEDNIIDASDLSIIQKANGSTHASSNWNENTDFNKDGIVNTFDLAIISKNMGQIGASGTWTSPIPKAETLSSHPVGSTKDDPVPSDTGGYWLWIPN